MVKAFAKKRETLDVDYVKDFSETMIRRLELVTMEVLGRIDDMRAVVL